MLGVGEAAAIPSFAKVAFNWFPRSERGLASSIFDSGSRVGSALSLPLVAWLISIVGWRGSFVITGGLGVVWALAWWFIYRDPERYRAIAPEAVDALAGAAQRARRARGDRIRRHGFVARSVSLPHGMGHDDRPVLSELRDLLFYHVVSELLAAVAWFLAGVAWDVGHACRRCWPFLAAG